MQGVVQSFDDSLMGSTVVAKFEVSCLTDSTSPGLATNVSHFSKKCFCAVSLNATLVNPEAWFPRIWATTSLPVQGLLYTHSGVLLDSTLSLWRTPSGKSHNPGPSSWQYDKLEGIRVVNLALLWNSSGYPYCNKATPCNDLPAQEALQYPDPNPGYSR